MPGFFRLLAVRVAYSRQLRCQLPNTSDAMQSDCICISTYRTLHRLLDFSCASPASPHLPAYLSNVSPFSSVPRLAHFAEKDSLFRDTRQSLACRTHAPSQPPTNHVPPRTPTSLICPDGYRHHLRSFNRSLRMTLFHSFGPTPPTFHTLTLPLPFCPSAPLPPPSLPPAPLFLPRSRPSNTSVARCKLTMLTVISGAPSVTAT